LVSVIVSRFAFHDLTPLLTFPENSKTGAARKDQNGASNRNSNPDALEIGHTWPTTRDLLRILRELHASEGNGGEDEASGKAYMNRREIADA